MTAARCEWAACKDPGHIFEGGWWHCEQHLLEHRLFTLDEAVRSMPREQLNEHIRLLHGQGLTDRAIGRALNLERSGVGVRRREMGLQAHHAPEHDIKPCGTTAAYRRHLRKGEPACEQCRQAEAQRRREHRLSQAEAL